MAYYSICPDCGGTLDPGEKCDCQSEKIQKREFMNRVLKMEKTGQVAMAFGKMGGSYGKESSC